MIMKINDKGREKMRVTSQSKRDSLGNDRVIEIPNDTPMLLAEDNKRIRSFRNESNVRVNDEIFFAGDLWKIEVKEN